MTRFGVVLCSLWEHEELLDLLKEKLCKPGFASAKGTFVLLWKTEMMKRNLMLVLQTISQPACRYCNGEMLFRTETEPLSMGTKQHSYSEIVGLEFNAIAASCSSK